ncbi:unnamed protein product [Ectocarpus fasciculatus]
MRPTRHPRQHPSGRNTPAVAQTPFASSPCKALVSLPAHSCCVGVPFSFLKFCVMMPYFPTLPGITCRQHKELLPKSLGLCLWHCCHRLPNHWNGMEGPSRLL